MKAARGIVCLLFVCLLGGFEVSAQAKPEESQPVTITSVLDNQLTLIERQIVPAADAMPEDKYSFSPTNGNFKGVRTFSEEVRHIATANTSFFGSILNLPIGPETENGPGSNGPDSIQTKAQIMQYLRDSFALGHKAIATINSSNELSPVKSPALPFVKTMAATAIFACQHMMDHYGQMVEYLRDNGIVPPASAKRPPAGSGGK